MRPIKTGKMMFRKGLSERLKGEAVKLGLCEQWQGEWPDGASKDDMAEKFVRGQDFCIKHDWPSVKVIKRHFGDVMHRHGVYADEEFYISNKPMLILVGKCEGHVVIDGRHTSTIYVRHTSRLHIKADGEARVFVSVYDDGVVEAEAEEYAKIFVYRHGGSVEKAEGDVRVREKAPTRPPRGEELMGGLGELRELRKPGL